MAQVRGGGISGVLFLVHHKRQDAIGFYFPCFVHRTFAEQGIPDLINCNDIILAVWGDSLYVSCCTALVQSQKIRVVGV